MKDNTKLEMIDNIDQKLNILYKNMNKNDYYKFINDNDEIRVYNDLLNNIALNICPTTYLMFLPVSVLMEINNKVYNQFNILLNTKELVLT